MRKLISAIIIILIILVPALSAHADVIFEPENDFYEQNSTHILPLRRGFVLNEKYDSASLREKPDAGGEIGRINRGEIVYIEYTCLYKGDFWGWVNTFRGETNGFLSGWIKMDQLLVLYDYISFEEEYGGQFYLHDRNTAAIEEAGGAISWPWPGAEKPLWTYEGLANVNFAFAYEDADGREWGFVTYLYGSRNIWICLSDPLNPDLPALIPTPEPGVWESDTPHIDIFSEQENEFPVIVVIIILVAALVTGTAILIRVFWRKNDEN